MRSLVIAPHPDDEVLGCGGTMLRRRSEGDQIAWLIVTKMDHNSIWTDTQIAERDIQISKIKNFFGFEKVYQLDYPTSKLEQFPLQNIISDFSNVLNEFKPNEVFIPFEGDVHSDHRIVFQAAMSSTKNFRAPYIDRLLSYETLSETDFNLSDESYFRPNYYVNIENQLQQKIEAMDIYNSELGKFPFPRSREAIISLARYRGSTSGFVAAEAFRVLKEIQK